MPHITLREGLPGMRGLLAFRPDTAKPIGELADVLLHAPGPIAMADRELIGAYVSALNDCEYCCRSHAAIAVCHLAELESGTADGGGGTAAELKFGTTDGAWDTAAELKFGTTDAANSGGSGETPESVVAAVMRDPESASISPKLKALLAIAARVQRDGRSVGAGDIARARAEGATDLEIHDTVLIAAAFCMFNRYVDGLATWTPADPEGYRERAAFVAKHGYSGVLTSQAIQPQEETDGRRA